MNEHLKATLGLDSSPFARGLRGVKGMTKDLVDGFTSSGIGGKLAGFFGGIFAIGAISNATGQILDYADAIGNTAERLDVGTDFLQAWNKQVTLSGGTTELATKGLEELTKRLGEAADSSSLSAKEFAKYGINVRNQDDTLKTTEQIVYDVAEAMKNAKTQAEANIIAFDLLGKSGTKLVNSLAGGREGLEQTIDSLKKLVPSNDEIQAVKELGDTLTGVKNTLLGIGTKGLAFLFGGAAPSLPTAQGEDMIAKLREQGMKFVGDEPAALSEEAKKALQKLQDTKRKFAIEDASGMNKVKLLREDEEKLFKEKLGVVNDAARVAEYELQILDKQRAIQKELLELDVRRAGEREKSAKKDAENQDLIAKFLEAKNDQVKFGSLEELAALDLSKAKTQELFYDIGRARQALGLRKQGEAALQSGDQFNAGRFFNAANANVSRISNLKTEENIQAMLKQLLALNAKIESGLIVIPKNAP